MSTGGVPACMTGSSADESDISRSVFGSVLRNLFMGWGGGGVDGSVLQKLCPSFGGCWWLVVATSAHPLEECS
jgi:hypothetical protein